MDVKHDGLVKHTEVDFINSSFFADIVDNAYLGYKLDYNDPFPWTFMFDGDLTQAEIDAVKQRLGTTQNEESLRVKARAALQTNSDFLAVASPSNAAVVAQVKALTRQNSTLIRLTIGALDSTSGT